MEPLRIEHRGEIEIGACVSSSLAQVFRMEDHHEGARAFLEKRLPQVTGR